MKCPACETDLAMAERQGIEIDYCPKCRGVWLDRGELDKIIERSMSETGHAASPTVPPTPPSGYGKHQKYEKHGGYYGHGKRRRKSMLGEIFDIFD